MLAKDTEREKAFKDVAIDIAREKVKVAELAKQRAHS